MSDRWFTGDRSGLLFPADPSALRDGGAAFLSRALQAPVREIIRCEEVTGGSTGRKMVLDVAYRAPHVELPTELFVKLSRDFDDPVRDRGRTQMESEVKFATLSLAPGFPVTVPTTLFADYHRDTGSGILITARILFGVDRIEPQYPKCLDYEMPRPADHYRALLTALARLAGADRSGRLPAHLTDGFPVDLRSATVGEPPTLTPERLQRRIERLADFVRTNPALLPDNVRTPDFLGRLSVEAPAVLKSEQAIWRRLADAVDYIALSHWNANVDNAWFWSDDGGALRCGLMDWGCVSRLNLAMALWGAMSGAETDLWNDHFDDLSSMFCQQLDAAGGPKLDPAELHRQTVLYAVLMGVTWLLDVPALVRAKAPDARLRTDAAIRDDESVRAPLQMLTNVLNLWERTDLGEALGEPYNHR